MQRILIVEDEAIVRKDLQRLIVWEDYGYTIVGEAWNGAEGLSLFLKLKPDIIITDVRMPVMDGLHMLGEIKKISDVTVQFIILTSYDDFDYARTALVYGVQSYILKHEISPSTLLTVLHKAENTNLTRQALRNYTLSNLISAIFLDQICYEEIMKNLFELGFHFKTDRTYMIGIAAQSQDKAVAICSEVLKQAQNDCESICLPVDDQRVIVLLVFHTNIIYTSFEKKLLQLADAFYTALVEQDVTRTYIIIGNKITDIKELCKEASQISEQLEEQFFLEDNMIGHLNKKKIIELSSAENLLENIEEFLSISNFDSVRRLVYSLYNDYIKVWRSKSLFKKYTTRVLILLDHTLKNLYSEEAENFEDLENWFRHLETLTNLSETVAWLMDIMDLITNRAEKKYSPLMLVAIKYLHLHYNENINLEAIAEILGVSTTHAGRLFKKETGMSFRAYLTDIRIRKAEQLLKSGKYRVYEVSYMVGYQTIQYFSESFKNITGKKPSDYTNGSD